MGLMKFMNPLQRGTLVKRYKRFLADIILDSGEAITAHVANSGAMLGTSTPGLEVWVSPATTPGRKLAWNWELCRVDGYLVGVNTSHPNAIAADAIKGGEIPELAGYPDLRREVKYGINSRIDILLTDPNSPPCYVEVKNVQLKNQQWAEFPDAVTARGTKHLAELSRMVEQGSRAVMLYLVQREDCQSFRPAAHIDPVYAKALVKAIEDGVEAICYTCKMSLASLSIGQPMPMSIR
jgi:sugar fermentation stimulation protein A